MFNPLKYKLLILITCLSIPCFAYDKNVKVNDLSVCFTPYDRCDNLILSNIEQAKKEILIQAYQFTSKPIILAVLQAKERGVGVKIILDKTQRKMAVFLANKGIETYLDTKPAIAHNKIMIIDGNKVITGSFNFSKNAQARNTENLLVLNGERISGNYKDYFYKRLKLSIKELQ